MSAVPGFAGRPSHGEQPSASPAGPSGQAHMAHHGRSKSSSLAMQPAAAMHVDAIHCGHHDRRHSGGCTSLLGHSLAEEKRWASYSS
jgi:hypothetical protein